MKDIISPVLGAHSRSPTLLVAPYEDLRPSKTGAFDENGALDVQNILALEYALRACGLTPPLGRHCCGPQRRRR